ncbi:MAG: hypothetical protein M3464_05450 [Chloroflexota bacterium]|nr:hypothetical protein [Chloroflexota bacterium]
MPADPLPLPPFAPPSPAEAAALKLAGDYLMRTGADAARCLFAGQRDTDRLAALSDSLLAGAMLCGDIIAARDARRRTRPPTG